MLYGNRMIFVRKKLMRKRPMRSDVRIVRGDGCKERDQILILNQFDSSCQAGSGRQ